MSRDNRHRLSRNRRAATASAEVPRRGHAAEKNHRPNEESSDGDHSGDDSANNITERVRELRGLKAAKPLDVLPEGVASAKKSRPKFTVEHLMKAEGMEWLRHHMPRHARFAHKDDAMDAVRLVEAYRGWCRRLFALPFDEMLSRIDKFGSKARVRNALESMRADQFSGHKKTKRDCALDLLDGLQDSHDNQADATDEVESTAVDAGAKKDLSDEVKKRIAAKREAALELRRQRKLQKISQDATSSAESTASPGLVAE